jgi:hypothetical protein
MFSDRTVYHLLDHIGCEVLGKMRDGKTLEEIDAKLELRYLTKKDRIVLFEHMLDRFVVDDDEAEPIAAHLRTLKRRKPPRRTQPPATVIPFRPEDRPT